VLGSALEPGSTVEIERAPESEREDDREVKITITPPPADRKREPVGVGAQGEEAAEGGDTPAEPASTAGGGDLPDDPEVLPEIPDAPPPVDEDDAESKD